MLSHLVEDHAWDYQRARYELLTVWIAFTSVADVRSLRVVHVEKNVSGTNILHQVLVQI